MNITPASSPMAIAKPALAIALACIAAALLCAWAFYSAHPHGFAMHHPKDPCTALRANAFVMAYTLVGLGSAIVIATIALVLALKEVSASRRPDAHRQPMSPTRRRALLLGLSSLLIFAAVSLAPMVERAVPNVPDPGCAAASS